MTDYVLICDVPLNVDGLCTGTFSSIDINNIEAVNPLATFDPVIFTIVNGSILVSFLVGHGAGRTVRWLGRA